MHHNRSTDADETIQNLPIALAQQKPTKATDSKQRHETS